MGNSILEKIGAYFRGCSDNFVTEGQEFAMHSPQISPAPRAHWYLAPSPATGISVVE
jgi:hypothetical protein